MVLPISAICRANSLRDIQLHLITTRAADDQDASANATSAQALPHCGLPDIIDHHIDAAPICQLVNRPRPLLFFFAIDRHVSAQRFGLTALFRIAADNVHGRARQLGNLNADAIDAAARSHDEHGLADLQSAPA